MTMDNDSIAIEINAVLKTDQVDYTKISEALSAAEKLQKQLDEIGKDQSMNIATDIDTDQVDYISEALSSMKTTFMEIGRSARSMGSEFANLMRSSFVEVFENINSLRKMFKTDDSGAVRVADGTKVNLAALGISEGSARLRDIAKASKLDIGMSKFDFNKFAPIIFNELLKERINSLSSQFGKSSATIGRYINALSSDSTVVQAYKNLNGSLTDKNIRNIIELSLKSFGSSALYRAGIKNASQMPRINATPMMFANEIMPEAFRKSFAGRGTARGLELNSIISNIKKRESAEESWNDNLYRQIQNYVEGTDEGYRLADILKQAQIMSESNGRYSWAKKITARQANYLAGLTSQNMYDLRRGFAYYDADPNDLSNNARLDRRNSKQFLALLDLQKILAKDADIMPNTIYDPSQWEDLSDVYRPNTYYARRGAVIKNVRQPKQFLIPKTVIDSNSNKLLYRDPSWQKKTGNEEYEDDQFVAISNSALLQMIQREWKDEGFGQGHGTFGYGRDETGKAIYKTPPLIKVSTNDFFKRDSQGFNPTLRTDRVQQFKDLVDPTKTKEYGGKQYTYAYQGDDAVYLMEADLKKKIEKRFEQAHMPSPFEGMNEGGLAASGASDKTIKQINQLKKITSNSSAYEELFGKLPEQMITRIMNMEALYEELGTNKPFRIDGAALGSSKLFKAGAFQARSGAGQAKYVVNPVDFQKMFRHTAALMAQGKAVDREKAVDKDSGTDNWLVSLGKDNTLDLWLPSITATKEMVSELMGRSNVHNYTDDQKRALREQYFFRGTNKDIGLILTESSVKNKDKFAYLSDKHFKGMFGEDAYQKAVSGNRVKNGIVELLPSQQGYYHDLATELSGGLQAMRTSEDFVNDPSIMPQQVAASIGISAEDMKRSGEEFRRRRERLRTTPGAIESLRENPYYSRKLDEDWRFLYSSAASSYIESQIKSLERAEQSGYIALDKNKVKAQSYVASVLPTAWIDPFLSLANVDENKIPTALRELLPRNMEKNNKFIGDTNISGQALLTRNPSAPGEIVVGNNEVDKLQRDLLNEWQVRYKNVIMMTPHQQYQMNTGDFDGDTVVAYTGLAGTTVANALKLKDEIKVWKEKIAEQEAAGGNDNIKVQGLGDELIDINMEKINALENQQKSVQAMGIASAAIRNALQLDDSDPRKYIALAQGMKAYDFATSEVKTKGAEFKLADYAQQMMSEGGTYTRFIKQLSDYSAEDGSGEPLGKVMFKANLPTIFDPQGLAARSYESIHAALGSSGADLFGKDLDKLLKETYGDSDTYEAQASRFYGQLFKKTLFGRLLRDEDLSRGDELSRNWLRNINARGGALGVSEEEMRLYNQFNARVNEMHSSRSMTRQNVFEEKERHMQKYVETGDEESLAKVELYERLLDNDEKLEKAYEAIDAAKEVETSDEQRRAIEERLKVAKQVQNDVQTHQSAWSKAKLAWSYVKNWIKTPLNLIGRRGELSSPYDFAVSFDDASKREAVARREIDDTSEQSADITIGNLMHSAYEEYFKQTQNPLGQRLNINQIFAGLLGDNMKYTRELEKYGLFVKNTGTDNNPIFSVSGPGKSDHIAKLNAMFGTSNKPGTIENFLKSLEKMGFDINNPINIEGIGFDKNRRAHEHGTDFKLSVPNKDENGNNKSGEYDDSKQTYSKPDVILSRKNKNGEDEFYIVDYKSSLGGAEESTVQSAYYASLYNRQAEAYLRARQKYDKGQQLSEQEQSDLIKDSFGIYGYLDNGGNYVSRIKGAIGFDARTGDYITISADENKKLWEGIYGIVQEAAGNKKLDAISLLENSPYAKAFASRATVVNQTMRQMAEATSEQRVANMGNSEADFLLTRYPKDSDIIREIRSSMWKEEDRELPTMSRFAMWKRKLQEALPDDLVTAAAKVWGEDSETYKQLQEEMIEKNRLLQEVNNKSIEAAVSDWDKIELDSIRSLRGIKESDSVNRLRYVNRKMAQGAAGKNDLISQVYIDPVTNEKINLYDYTRLIGASDASEGFVVDHDNQEVASRAKMYRDRYIEAVEREKEVGKTIGLEFNKSFDTQKQLENSEWDKIAGQVEDPAKVVSDYMAKKSESVQKMIDSWNAEVSDLQDAIDKGNVEQSVVPLYEAVIEDRKQRIGRAVSFLQQGSLNQVSINELEKQYGMSGFQDKTKSWLDKRIAVLEAQKVDEEASVQNEYSKLFKRYTENGMSPTVASIEAMTDARNNDLSREYNKKIEDRIKLYENYSTMFGDIDNLIEQHFYDSMSKDPLTRQKVVDNTRLKILKSIIGRFQGPEDPTYKNFVKQIQENGYIDVEDFVGKISNQAGKDYQMAQDEKMRQSIIANFQNTIQAERFETQSDQMLRNWNARNATNAISRNLLQRRSMYDQFRNEINISELNIKQAQEKLNQAQNVLNNPQATSQQKFTAQKDIDSATESLEHYSNALRNAQEGKKQFENEDGQFSEGLNAFKATIDTVSQSVDRLVQRFGRQVMRKAFNEAKTFVVQFDKQMRSIQTITMKTDEQMQAVKKSTVDRAIELKTSVANVAQVEADLYRQGLNDKQVEERASAIIKFATITGAKMTDAGKAITTAIQNGLVASAEEAMDVLVSLGDSAATTANEIFKGMQKSAAAAKVAGVSYDELTTLLTIGTSKTQLSGQVIGTGLQTIFSRMNRVTNKGYVDDETGASVSINDVEKALRSAGVQLREAGGRSFRNSFDVLRDLSRVWESLNDIQRNNITYTMAGGRQQNIFQSLMEGMAEDGGAEVERLLGLAENSEGAANNKYEIFVKSITSAVEELKSTYDGLIASLENDGSIVGVIESFTSFVNGLKNISDTSGKAAGGITLITSAVVGLGAALAMALSGAPGLLVTLIGVLSGAGILGFASMAGQNKVEDPKVQAQQQIEKAGEYYNNNKQKRIEPIQKQIDEVRKLGEAYDKAKESDESFTPEKTTDFESKLSKLSDTFSNLTGNINNNKTSIDDWKSVVEGVEGSIDKIDKTAAETADRIALKSFKITNPIDELTQLESKTKTPFTGFNGYVEESDLDWIMNLTQDLPENYRGLTAKSNINKVINKYGNVLSPTLLQLAKDFSDNIGIGRKFDEGQYKSIMSYLVNAIGIGFDPYSESIINAYDDFKGTKPYLQWINSFKDENKTMEVDTAESLAQALTYLEPNEINDFLHMFMQFTSENQQENSSYYSKQYDNERKERIANLLEVLTTDDIITGEDEVLKKGLANRLFEQTKHLSASELDDSVNTLLKYYSTLGNDDIKKMFYKDSDYNYSYRDENGNILFGFDDLDKAEEEYAKHYSDVSITDTDNKKINNINNQIAELQTALTRQVDELGSYETESELKQKISEKEKYISSLKIIAQNKKELYEAQKAQVDLLSESGEDIPESAGRTLAKMYQDWASAERDWYIEEDLLKWYTDRYDDVKARNLSVASISKNISNLLKERSEEEANLPSKTPSGFDILRIFNKGGSKVYQNLSEFVGDRDIAKQDYIDTYQKLLGYLAQNVDYSGAVGDINNVVEQLPNFAGVLDSDAELLKMLKSFENNDGKYNYQQLLEYVQKKTLGESISEAVSSVSSSAYEYNKQMSAINAIRSGNASSDQYDSIIKQYGITRSELEKNPELYLALENVRLQSSRNAFEQNAANYISGWLKSYYNEDELKEMSGRNFDDIWQMFIDRMAKDNPNMASTLNNVMSLFKNAGHAFSINGEGAVSSVFTGKPISNNLLDEYDVKLTNSTLIEEYVNQLVSAGSEANKLFGELPQQIQQQLQGFAGLADYIKTYGQNTKEAAQAQKELSNAILEGTIKALEDEGKIITGLAPQLETIRYGNIIDSTKQINQLSSQIVEIADVQAAYNRLINGGVTRKEDWDLIQSFWGISNNDIEKYQTGRKNLTEDYGNRISELANVQSVTGNTIAEEIIAAYAGENILKEEEVEPDNIFRRITNLLGITEPVKMKKRDVAGYLKNIDNSDVINLNKRLSPYGVQIKDGELVSSDISNQLLSFGQQLQATLDIRSALGQGNQMQDYRTMLNYYNIGGVNGLTRGIEAAQRVGGIFNTTAANDLLSNEEFVTAVQDNDINKIRNILLRGAYGVEAPNSTRMNTVGVMDYISAVLSGDKAKLYELSKPENKNIFDYLSGMSEFQEAYSSVMADLQLEKYQVDALRGASTYNELFERERNKELRAGTAQLGQTLVSGTDQERREALNAQAAQIQSLSKTSKTIDYLVEHQGESNEALWDELQSAVGLNDEQIEYYKKHTKELKNIQKDIDKDSTDIGEGLKAAIVSAFGLENFGDIVEEGKEDLRALVEAIFDINGLNFNIENEEISAKERYASAGDALISTALDVSGYANEQEITTRRNAIADIVRNSQDVASFAQAFEEAAATNEWMKDSNILKQVLGTDMSKNLALANAGVINWEDFQNRIVQGTGYGSLIKDTSFEDYSSILERYTGENLGNIDAEGFTQFVSQFGETTGFTDWLKGIEGGEDVLREIGEAGSVSAETLKKFNANFDAAKIRDAKQWGDSTDAVADNVANLGKTAKSARETLRSMATQLSAVEKNQYYRQKYQGGDRSKETVSAIAGMIGMTEEDVKKGGSLIDEFLKAHEQDDIDSVNVWADTMSEMIADSLKGKVEDLPLDATQLDIIASGGSVNVDLSQVQAMLDSSVSEQLNSMIAMLEAKGFAYHIEATGGENGTVRVVVDNLGSGKKGGGGGGGGGGKSKAQKLMEELKREQQLRSHEIKMIQYQETKYENAGEIGNQNRMIELENIAQQKLIKSLETAIQRTKEQMAQTKKGSDDWYSLYESILSYEEGIEEANQAIADNTKKIKENQQAILKLRTDLEDTVNSEIEARKQRDRDMLAGSVNMQDTIIEAIRQRYRDEWELIEKDIDKKRQALEEEKNLIDERLQRRKDAEDEAEKYEELMEYKRQLALIEMDSTRTRDAAKLREKIADMEKDRAWKIAEDEAEYQKEQIDEQIQAYDDFITYGNEDLEDYLEDANNFADEVNGILQMNQEGIINWLKSNVKDYALAMDDAQKQMIQGWEDTYDEMLGITHTYWEEITAILSGKNLFLNYMKESQEYINASEAEQQQMLYGWSEAYDNWLAAQKNDAVYSHSDEELNSAGQTEKNKSRNNNNKTTVPGKITEGNIITPVFNVSVMPDDVDTITMADAGTKTTIDKIANLEKQNTNNGSIVDTVKSMINNIFGTHFAEGGLVNYTGPAWVDGSPMKPEAFLDSEDTALMRSFLDEAKYVRYRSSISNIDSRSLSGNEQNIGELIINITEAQFKDDADFDEVAQRVGEKFVKELSKQGFHTLSYAF